MTRPVFARFYARVSPSMDRGGVATRRRQLLAGLSGRVIEVGAGNGLNHTGRDIVAALAAAGFDIRRLNRFRFPEAPIPTPTSLHVLGVAIGRPIRPTRPGRSQEPTRQSAPPTGRTNPAMATGD